MPMGLHPAEEIQEWIESLARSIHVGSDLESGEEVINTSSDLSTSLSPETDEGRRWPCPIDQDTPPVTAATTFSEARRWPIRPNPFLNSDSEMSTSTSEEVGVRVRQIDYTHLPPQYQPTLTLHLPENLPRLQRGQVLVIPLRLTLQLVHPDDVADI
jgi:hypothetical protein